MLRILQYIERLARRFRGRSRALCRTTDECSGRPTAWDLREADVQFTVSVQCQTEMDRRDF